MIKRTIEISTQGTHISLSQGNIVFSRDKEEVGRLTCEDLGVLILDTPQMTTTQAALVAACEAGASVVLCGRNHHPAGLLLPLSGNTLHAERLRTQIEAKKPLKKQLWRQIVRAKLKLQASVLPEDNPARNRILALRDRVRSGDTGNCEAQAAKIYWHTFFGDESFRRERDGLPPNNFLNYGYMALRAATSRALSGAGLHPAIGLEHHHRENSFALADDLMEAFRPFVDLRVARLWREGKEVIDREAKEFILSVLSDQVKMKDEKGPLLVSLQKSASSLYECMAGRESYLKLPEP